LTAESFVAGTFRNCRRCFQGPTRSLLVLNRSDRVEYCRSDEPQTQLWAKCRHSLSSKYTELNPAPPPPLNSVSGGRGIVNHGSRQNFPGNSHNHTNPLPHTFSTFTLFPSARKAPVAFIPLLSSSFPLTFYFFAFSISLTPMTSHVKYIQHYSSEYGYVCSGALGLIFRRPSSTRACLPQTQVAHRLGWFDHATICRCQLIGYQIYPGVIYCCILAQTIFSTPFPQRVSCLIVMASCI
jgi:hypothetical protein